jgi:hypothetical protein
VAARDYEKALQFYRAETVRQALNSDDAPAGGFFETESLVAW